MNARLSIFFGYPPLGVWITAVNASENMTYEGPVYWNLLIDLNQNGEWDGGEEWVVRDKVIALTPGEHETLISPAFKVPTSGSPWGRINFPFWVRSMVSSESVKDKVGSGNWDGRGTDDGFEIGEVEDYFVEWRPIGQILPNPPQPIQANGCTINSSDLLEQIPSDRRAWEAVGLVPGIKVEDIQFFGIWGPEGAGETTASEVLPLDQNSTTTLLLGENEFEVTIDNRLVRIDPQFIGESGRIIAIPGIMDPSECTGSGIVLISPGVYSEFHPETGETVIFEGGFFGVTTIAIIDKAGHVTFVGMPEDLLIEVLFGSITIKGPHPWVEVSGDYDEAAGSFSASGQGTVAGFPGIAVTFEGTVDANGISGEYTMGANGGLPQSEPIVYKVEGPLQEDVVEDTPQTGPLPLAPGVADAIESFVSVFNAAFQDKNVEHLYQLLHPEVIGIYGEESCRAYLEGIVEIPTSLEYLDATKVGQWEWDRDGTTLSVDHAYAVQMNFSATDQTTEQEMHLTLPGDDSVRWFTDCGDPAQ
jgi:hypothetical protein